MEREKRHTLIVASLIAMGLGLAALGLGRPIGQEDTYHLMAARLLAGRQLIVNDGSGGLALHGHPPLYPWLVLVAQTALGRTVWAARMVGWLGYGLTGALLFVLVRRLSQGEPQRDMAALIAVGLYLSSPAAIQGTALLDIDTAVLPAWTALWIYLFLGLVEPPSVLGFATLAGATAVGLAIKLSTPPVVLALGFLSLLVAGRHGRASLWACGAVASGAAFFAGTYSLWGRGRGLAVSELVDYILRRVASSEGAQSWTWDALAKSVVQLALWTSPYFLCLVVGAVVWGLARRDWRVRMTAGIGGVLLAGYLVVGGTSFGFPRLHAPALPVLCAVAGLWIASLAADAGRGFWLAALPLTCLVALWNLLIVGDLLFTLRYDYRLAAAVSDVRAAGILREFAWRCAALVVPALAVIPIAVRLIPRWKERFCLALLVLAVGGALALDGLQGISSFSVYQYGEVGAERVAKFLQSRIHPDGRVIATREILFYLGKLDDPASYPFAVRTWNDPVRFRSELSDPRLEAVVYGVAANTIGEYRRVFQAQDVRQAFEARFRRAEIGGYTVWWRAGP